MKEKLTRTEFVDMFEMAWSESCQHESSYIEDVGVEQALQDERDSLQDGLQEDYAFKRYVEQLRKVIDISIDRK